MGKDLRGKELGIGISQRKDGRYSARYVSKRTGKTIQKYFDKLQECRKWYMESKFNDENISYGIEKDMTVENLYNLWMKQDVSKLRERTKINYRNMYKIIPDDFKEMNICDVKAIHCEMVVDELAEKYGKSTIEKSLSVIKCMFNKAYDNDFIIKNPVSKRIKIKGESKYRSAMSLEDQKKFFTAFKKYKYYNICYLVLQTGMRAGEVLGLQWDCVDFENKEIIVDKQIQYFNKKGWEYVPPKSKKSNRIIPLTDEAILILKNQKNKRHKVSDIRFSKNVFLTEQGKPIHSNNVDYKMKDVCKKIGIPDYTLHNLRHTFCTRAFESGISSKIIQEIMGHTSLNTTMEIYTHLSDKIKHYEIDKISDKLKIV